MCQEEENINFTLTAFHKVYFCVLFYVRDAMQFLQSHVHLYIYVGIRIGDKFIKRMC